jgi:hypothetical protein
VYSKRKSLHLMYSVSPYLSSEELLFGNQISSSLCDSECCLMRQLVEFFVIPLSSNGPIVRMILARSSKLTFLTICLTSLHLLARHWIDVLLEEQIGRPIEAVWASFCFFPDASLGRRRWRARIDAFDLDLTFRIAFAREVANPDHCRRHWYCISLDFLIQISIYDAVDFCRCPTKTEPPETWHPSY